MTTANIKAIATPSIDVWGKTGYGDSPGVGLSVSSDNFFIKASHFGNDLYPNYNIRASIHEMYMGSFTGNITPTLKDSGGIIAKTSGPIPVSLKREFCWGNANKPMPTTIARKVTTSTETVGLIIDSLDWFHSVNINEDQIASYVYANREWNTLMAISQTAGLYNEVKFEHVSGDTNWAVTRSDDLTTQRAKGTYYDVKYSAVKSASIGTASTSSSVIRATFRNKINNSTTFSQEFTLQLIKN